MKKRGKSKPRAHKPSRHRPAEPVTMRVGTRPAGSHRASAAPSGLARATARMATAANSSSRLTTVGTAYESDERQALALLLLPFLMVAVALGLSQTLKPVARLIEAARPSPQSVAVADKVAGSITLSAIALPAAVPAALKAPERIVLGTPLALPREAPYVSPAAPSAPAPTVAALIIPPPPVVIPIEPPTITTDATPADLAVLMVPPPPIALPIEPPRIAPADGLKELAGLTIPILPTVAPAILVTPVMPAPNLTCLPTPKLAALTRPPAPAEFGLKLAEAAKTQTRDFVIYSATYKRIAYPMGDVPSLYGACSDVIIRAYRALGIDLQELVQRSRIGSGDPNIDHRRTDTLRAFFAKFGDVIPASTFAEDYQAGDIVTYYRPFSRVSRAHIAIVSDVIGPSGRPMIVHNRGWGPQLEDALFVDRITGHYRFTGAPQLATPTARIAGEPVTTGRAMPKLPLPKPASPSRTARGGNEQAEIR